MRTTSNPAFRNLRTGSGRPLRARTAVAERTVTIDDVVLRTAGTLGVAAVSGAIAAWLVLAGRVTPVALTLPAMLIAFALSLIITCGRTPGAALVLLYACAEGVLLGGVTGAFELFAPGIALPAISGTFGVFAAMLVVYRTGSIRVTPRLTKWIIGATFGVTVAMLVNLVAGMFGGSLGLRDGGPLAIVFSLVLIGVAAFNFLLDFDSVDEMVRNRMPVKWAWWAAFGLVTTLIWLYLEILRLLLYFWRKDD